MTLDDGFCKVHSSPSSMFSRGMQVLTTALLRPPKQVVIALMSFPFLVFALPLVQDWVTHVKPTGYDRSGKYGD